MKKRKIMILSLAMMMAVSSLTACVKNNPDDNTDKEKYYPLKDDTEIVDDTDAVGKEIVISDMTLFSVNGDNGKDDDNEIMDLIAQKTGVRVKDINSNGQTDEYAAVQTLLESDELPDFVDIGDSMKELYESGKLVAWDNYLEKYPNLKEMYTDEEWDKFRMEDGHIYWADISDQYYKEDTNTIHDGEAFWIQARVLEAYDYPEINTLDRYFEILEKYASEYPTLPDGTTVIPYTCYCDDWYYYSIENAPMFLDGYPNDYCCIVDFEDDKTNPQVVDYNTTPTAEKYFRKLNEEYNNGIIDPEFASQTGEDYIEKLSSGCVLGMCDQYWNFSYGIKESFSASRKASDGSSFCLANLGCDYVPLGLTIDEGMEQQWHTYGGYTIDASSGIAVTTSCENPDLAFEFMSRLLDQDIHDLRFWGVEGTDYLVNDNGMYYRTPEMRDNWNSDEYKAKHTCEYACLPQWLGMSRDGKNCMQPCEQPSEFLATLPKSVSDCLQAYGCGNYVDMIGSCKVYANELPWFSLSSWFESSRMDISEEGSVAWTKMNETKHEWLPKIIMSKNFDGDWKSYLNAYNACNPQRFFDDAKNEVDERVGKALDKMER